MFREDLLEKSKRIKLNILKKNIQIMAKYLSEIYAIALIFLFLFYINFKKY